MRNQKEIRNFCIISHVNHGKSTLADRFLELTGTLAKEKIYPQFLDRMELEREKGITIKMQPVRMNYNLNAKTYTLNLIDTPGHIDFSYEVSRSLAAVEGAILLVDAIKGIQAQTIHNLELAKKPSTRAEPRTRAEPSTRAELGAGQSRSELRSTSGLGSGLSRTELRSSSGLGAGLVPHRNEVSGAGQNLKIIPAINKIDLVQAKIEEAKEEISQILNIDQREIFSISAKTGKNVGQLLKAIIEKIPPPAGNENSPFLALIFDSKYDPFKGVIAFLRVFDGKIKSNENFYLIRENLAGKVREVGYFKPDLTPCPELKAGEIGYLATGIKKPGKVRVGETVTKPEFKEIKPLAGYQIPKPMVFVNLYPENAKDFEILKEGLEKLKLEDPSFSFELRVQEFLGKGYLAGFLGSLHAEILIERLKREFSLNLIISNPSVVYRIIGKDGKESFVFSPADWPKNLSLVKEIQEPWVKSEIIFPKNYLGQTLAILENLEGKFIEKKIYGKEILAIIYETPLREIIKGFYDQLKGKTQGYASLNYEILGYRPGNLVKLEILIGGKKEEAFSKILPKEKAFQEGKKLVKKLKEILPPQIFPLPIQAQVSGKIIARETLPVKRKDVLAPLYGGDYTRKQKLLEKQKRGKKRLKEKFSGLKIPPQVFLEIFKSS